MLHCRTKGISFKYKQTKEVVHVHQEHEQQGFHVFPLEKEVCVFRASSLRRILTTTNNTTTKLSSIHYHQYSVMSLNSPLNGDVPGRAAVVAVVPSGLGSGVMGTPRN